MNNNPILRIIIYNNIDYNYFEIIEDILLRANIEVKSFSGGKHLYKKHTFVDFYIKNFNTFDVEFTEQVISTIIKDKFEVIVYKKDIHYDYPKYTF